MAETTLNIRADPALAGQARQVLARLGLSLDWAVNVFFRQIIHDQAMPLAFDLSTEQSVYADLLRSAMERELGQTSAEEALAIIDRAMDRSGSLG